MNKNAQTSVDLFGVLVSLNQLWVTGLAIWIGYFYSKQTNSILFGMIIGIFYAACFHFIDKAIYVGAKNMLNEKIGDTFWIIPLSLRVASPWVIAGFYLRWFF